MKNIQDYSFEDGKITRICMYDNFVELLFEQWNNKEICLCFEEYWRIKDNHSIGEGVGELLIKPSSALVNEIIKDIIDGSGSEEEVNGLSSYSFVSSWGDRVLFEIVARNVEIKELNS